LSLDPLQAKYPGLSAYNFCANNPIMYVDKDGRDIWVGFEATGDYSHDASGHTVIYKTTYEKVELEIDGKMTEMYKVTGIQIVENFPYSQIKPGSPDMVKRDLEANLVKQCNGIIEINSDTKVLGSNLNITKQTEGYDPDALYVTPDQKAEEDLLDKKFDEILASNWNFFEIEYNNCTDFAVKMLSAIGVDASGKVDNKTNESTPVSNPNMLFQNLKNSGYRVLKETGDLSSSTAVKYIDKCAKNGGSDPDAPSISTNPKKQ
jgi:hypothetical protein